MRRHPFKESIENKITGLAGSVTTTAILWFTLIFYLETDLFSTLIAAISFLLPLLISLYYYWYISGYFKNFASRVVAAGLTMFISAAVSYTIYSMFDPHDQGKSFVHLLPLMMIIGLSIWFVTVQWYKIHSKPELYNDESSQVFSQSGGDTSGDDSELGGDEKLNQITVKEGSRIHIIKTGEINYIQAYGDYVMLFTANGKHIKEQTMKYFEANLPGEFIRIHRSCIVNSEKILRAELFGKESYSVYLKDGVCLRASISGYKLLKERLRF